MRKQLRVALLAEDERTRLFVRKALEGRGAEVLPASTGIELLEYLAEDEVVDVVFGVESGATLRAPTPTSLQVLASSRTFGDMTPFVIVDEHSFSKSALAAAHVKNAAIVPTFGSAFALIEETSAREQRPLHRHGEDEPALARPASSPDLLLQALLHQ